MRTKNKASQKQTRGTVKQTRGVVRELMYRRGTLHVKGRLGCGLGLGQDITDYKKAKR